MSKWIGRILIHISLLTGFIIYFSQSSFGSTDYVAVRLSSPEPIKRLGQEVGVDKEGALI